MAQVPYDPNVRVAPQAAPTPTQNVQAPAEAFGANVLGEAAKQFGAATGQVSDALSAYAEHYQSINNAIASQTKTAQFVPIAESAWAEFQAHNQGVDPQTGQPRAAANLGKFYQDLEAQRAALGAGLSLPARAEYDAQTKNIYSRIQGQATTFAVSEREKSFIASSNARVSGLQSDAVQKVLTDPAGLQSDLVSIRQQIETQGDQLGWTKDQRDAEFREKGGAIFASGIDQAYAQGDLARANSILAEHGRDMTPAQLDSAEKMLRTANGAADVAGTVHAAIFGGGTASGPDNRSLAQIEHDESGGRNIVNYKEARGERGHTASGYYQISDPTWKEFAPPEVSAQYPRAMDAPHDVQTQVAQIIQARTGNTRWAESAPKGGGGSAIPPQPLPTPGSNLEEWQASAMSRANAAAQARWPGDIPMQERALGEAQKQIKLTLAPVEAQQKANYEDALSTIQGQNIQDVNSLNTALPNLASTVSPQQFRGLEAAALSQGRILTPVQQATEITLVGQIADVKAGRLDPHAVDIAGSGLPANQQLVLGKQLAEASAKPAASGTDRLLEHALATPQAKAALSGLGITVAKRPADYYHFVGLVQQGISQWSSTHDNKPPDDKALSVIISQATAAGGGKIGIDSATLGDVVGRSAGAAVVPPNEAAAITRQWVARFHTPPRSADIQRLWIARQQAEGNF